MSDDVKLKARIWRRTSVEPHEWVLELEGETNDCNFVCRHTEPLTTPIEDVAALPSLYAPDPEAVALLDEAVKELRALDAKTVPDRIEAYLERMKNDG